MDYLAPYEPAARLYCQKTGVDPDTQMAVPHPLGIAVPHSVPRWQVVADDMIDLCLKMQCIREAQAKPVIVQ